MKKIFVNGTFDIIHVGHIKLLQYAKSLGDHLTVAIDSDMRVNSLKGLSRPINNQDDRRELLLALGCVDRVVIFHNDLELVQLIEQCDVMVKGSDYMGKHIVGESVCKSIVYYDRIDKYSTTNIIQRVVDRR
jgi:D-beta-D-heptose 7-phosphate kinase/D-beta-D-heptose 1-phosphate adenosyltransferase